MKHTYSITGMTCNGCKSQVEKAIANTTGVTEVTVDLDTASAVVVMEKHIPTATFQKALPDKYTITAKEEKNIFGSAAMASAEMPTEKQSKLQQLKPLLLILGYIAIAAVLLNYKTADWQSGMLDFMGLFFIVFSFFKILDLKGFPVWGIIITFLRNNF